MSKRRKRAKTLNGWSIQGDLLVAHRNKIVITIAREEPGDAGQEDAKQQESWKKRAAQEAERTGCTVSLGHNPEVKAMTGQAITVRISDRGRPLMAGRMKPNNHGSPEMTLREIAESTTPEAFLENAFRSHLNTPEIGRFNPEQDPDDSH